VGVSLRQGLDVRLRRPNHLQATRIDLLERDLAVHRSGSELRDLIVAFGEHVDAFDRDERRVDVEKDVAVLRRHALTTPTRSEKRSRMWSGCTARSSSSVEEPVLTTATSMPLLRAARTSIGISPTKSASSFAQRVASSA